MFGRFCHFISCNIAETFYSQVAIYVKYEKLLNMALCEINAMKGHTFTSTFIAKTD